MADPTLIAEVTEVVRRSAKIAPTVLIQADSRLVEDLAIDSLDLVSVFVTIQDEYDVVIDDEDVPHLRRVSDLAAYVTRHRESAAA
jgi:acyl carrier protein